MKPRSVEWTPSFTFTPEVKTRLLAMLPAEAVTRLEEAAAEYIFFRQELAKPPARIVKSQALGLQEKTTTAVTALDALRETLGGLDEVIVDRLAVKMVPDSFVKEIEFEVWRLKRKLEELATAIKPAIPEETRGRPIDEARRILAWDILVICQEHTGRWKRSCDAETGEETGLPVKIAKILNEQLCCGTMKKLFRMFSDI